MFRALRRNGHYVEDYGTVPCQVTARVGSPPGSPHQLSHPPCTPQQVNTTMTLQSALAEIKRLKPGDSFSYRALAKKHSCSSTTLTEHHQGRRTSHAESQLHQRLLHPRDEVELVQYIRGLTERHIPPTRQMIINFATPLCRWEPSDSWVTRFLTRNSNTLITAWNT